MKQNLNMAVDRIYFLVVIKVHGGWVVHANSMRKKKNYELRLFEGL